MPKKKESGVVAAVEAVEAVVEEVQNGVEKEIKPIRRSILKRFPTLFLLAVTFGVSLVFYSIEVLFQNNSYVQDHPWLTLGIGLLILTVTGTLYRKLE